MTFFKTTLLFTLLMLTAAAAGCGAAAERDTGGLGSADIIATITEVQPGGGAGVSGTISLEVRQAEAGAQSARYIITVGSDVPVSRQIGEELGDMGEVGFTALQAGQRVEVWLTGPVAESNPMQGSAKFIVINGPAEP